MKKVDGVVDLSDKLKAYQEYVEPIRHCMIQAVWRLVRNADDTDDVVQEALERVLKVIPKLRKHPNPTAYILRICINAAYDHLRRNKNRMFSEEPRPASFEQLSSTPDPSESLAQKEKLQQTLGAIGQLPKREMEALILLVFEDFSYAEIAQAMGCRENSIRSMIAKARKRLSRMVGEFGSMGNLEVQES